MSDVTRAARPASRAGRMNFKATAEYRDWVRGLAIHTRAGSCAETIDKAVARYAESVDYPPPPRRAPYPTRLRGASGAPAVN